MSRGKRRHAGYEWSWPGADVTIAVVPITSEDMVRAAARVHLEAFVRSESTRIGHRYVRRFIDWFRCCQDAIALAACAGEEVCGYVVGAPVGYQLQMYRDLLLVAASSLITRPVVLLHADVREMARTRLEMLLGRTVSGETEPSLPRPTMVLDTIGVSPKWQGRQVGDRLMEVFEAEARARQMKSLRLTVLKSNAAARHLYERRGWQPWVSETGKRMHCFLLNAER